MTVRLGIIQKQSPQAIGLAGKQSADNRTSDAFGGVTNTVSQGYSVPLLYGERCRRSHHFSWYLC